MNAKKGRKSSTREEKRRQEGASERRVPFRNRSRPALADQRNRRDARETHKHTRSLLLKDPFDAGVSFRNQTCVLPHEKVVSVVSFRCCTVAMLYYTLWSDVSWLLQIVPT
jgi:hypothetical protein